MVEGIRHRYEEVLILLIGWPFCVIFAFGRHLIHFAFLSPLKDI